MDFARATEILGWISYILIALVILVYGGRAQKLAEIEDEESDSRRAYRLKARRSTSETLGTALRTRSWPRADPDLVHDLSAHSAESLWTELCRVDDVAVLLDRGSAWSSPLPRVQVRETRGHTSLLEAKSRSEETVPPQLMTGDPELDSKLLVTGDAALRAAALDVATRKCLLTLLDQSSSELFSLTRDRIMERCPELTGLAKSLSALQNAGELRAALLHNARCDALPGVRLRNTEASIERFASDSAVVALTLDALTDADPHLRLLGAMHAPELAKVSETQLQAVLTELVGGNYPAPLRAKALEAHARRLAAAPELRRYLTDLLKDDSEIVRTAAFEQLAARGWQPEQGTLSLAGGDDGALSLSDEPSSLADSETSRP